MNRNATRLVACVGILAVAGVACGTDAEQRGAVKAPEHTVTIKLIAFTPTRVELPAGGTVTWRNEDVATHTVTSGRTQQSSGTVTATPDGTFDSKNLAKGQTFQFTFAQPGEYPFFCAVHPATMTGVIAVT